MLNTSQIINVKYHVSQFIIISPKFNFLKVLTIKLKRKERNFGYSLDNLNQHHWHIPICPDIDKKRNKMDFQSIKSRIAQKLARWNAQTLSAVGKVILGKFNLTCIPQYTMNLFKTLKYICIEIDSTNQKNIGKAIVKIIVKLIILQSNLQYGIKF